jgi:hypothetical protein
MLRDSHGRPALWVVGADGRIHYNLHPFQKECRDDNTTTYLFFIAGSGVGKSSFIPIKLESWIKKNRGGRYLVVEPSYQMVETIARPYVMEYFEHTPLKGKWDEKHRRYSGNGFVIYFGSADKPDLLEGGQYDGIICDEIGGYRRRVWQVLYGRVLLKEGQFFGLSTPYPGRTQAWIADEPYEEWKHGNPQYKFVQCPSIANPAFPKAEFERLRRELPPDEFAMRYLGELRHAVGLIFELNEDSFVEPFEPTGEVWVGLDFGFGHPTAFSYMTQVGDSCIIFREYQASGLDYETHVMNNLQWFRKYGVIKIFYDPSNPQGAMEIRKAFMRHGVQVLLMAAINDLQYGIQSMTKAFGNKTLKIAHICNELKDQIRNYIWMKNKPIDEGDDLIDASRYGYLGWLTSQNLRKEIIEDMPRKTDAMLHVEGLFKPDRARGWMRRI